MSETDPKGYYACLGVRPWATAAEIRAAYHRCAKQWHPDVDPRAEAKARFQAITEAYRVLRNPVERAIYDRSARVARPQSDTTRLKPVRMMLAELVISSAALGNRWTATLLLLGVLSAAVLLVEFLPGATESAPSLLPPVPSASSKLEARTRSEELASTSVQAHPRGAADPARSAHPSLASVRPRSTQNETSPISGAWLFRDLPNQKPQINLLTREEAYETQRHLIERGYLLGPADGFWGPRSQAALEDFRRAHGLASDDGWTSERQSAPTSQVAQATGLSAGQAGVEQAFPPDRPPELPDGLGTQELNDPADEIADAAPEPRAGQLQQVDPAPYVGAWAPSRAACARTEVPPLAISAQRASSFGGLAGECEFRQVRREGDGWRASARCFADGKRWTANVHLRATSSTLIWSSERGRGDLLSM